MVDKDNLSILFPGNDLAFLLCGSGDGRHLFAIVPPLILGIPGGRPGVRKLKKVHLTVVDINAAAIAKMLIILDMLTHYTIMNSKSSHV